MAKFNFDKDDIFKLSVNNSIELGTIGKSGNRINYNNSFEEIRKNEKVLINRVTGIAPKNIIVLNQVHEDSIIQIDHLPEKDCLSYADADGMITDQTNLCLVIRTADCVPVIAYDSKNKVLGVAHSGWKGTRLSISSKLTEKMNAVYNSNFEDIYVYILPSIGPDSYSIQNDVAVFFKNYTSLKEGKIYLNLWRKIEDSLVKIGIPKKNIHKTHICTMQNNDDFFSYRAKDIGRNLNFAYTTTY